MATIQFIIFFIKNKRFFWLFL